MSDEHPGDTPPALAAVWAKVDAFFARVEARHADDMQCRSGCFDCCQAGLTVTAVEADAIRACLGRMAPDARARLAADARGRRGDEGDACVALDERGRCRIYDARPVVCRSHGVPVRLRAPGALPVIDACPRNFRARGVAAVEDSCVLDQATLSALVLAANNAWASATQLRVQTVRQRLVDVLADGEAGAMSGARVGASAPAPGGFPSTTDAPSGRSLKPPKGTSRGRRA